MKKQILLSCAFAWAVMAGAETIDITTFRYAGPYVVQAPFQVDSVDVNSKTFVSGRLLDTHLSVDVLQQGTLFTGGVLPCLYLILTQVNQRFLFCLNSRIA